jgi:hypothetical protein
MKTKHVGRMGAALGLLLLPFCLAAQQNASAPRKFALVIGNAAYSAQTPLRNTPNDAADMKGALEGLGFQVDMILNGTLRQKNDGVRSLAHNL